MAKIALICKDFHPTTRELAWALYHQKFEVMVITSKNVHPSEKLPFQILSYFQKWSTLEAVSLIPRLLSNTPEIWHFVFHSHRDRPTMAHVALALFAQGLPRRMVASSLFTTPHKKNHWTWKGFFHLCDLATLGTRENLMSLKRRHLLPDKILTEVLPPLQSHHFAEESPDEDVEKFCQSAKPFIFIPATKVEATVIERITQAGFSAVLNRQRPSFNPKPRVFYFSTQLSDQELLSIAKASSSLLLAFSSYSVYELLKWQRLSEVSGTPLIVNPYQVECLPGLVLHEKTGWILQNGEPSLDLLLHNKDLRLAKPVLNKDSRAPIDSSMNGLNRLYIQILQKKQVSY